MVGKIIRKAGEILRAARLKKLLVGALSVILCMGTFSAPVFASDDQTIIAKATKKSSQKHIEPEEWNQSEVFAYQFDSGEDLSTYMLTGGLHYYNENYKEKDHWVKVKVVDPGIFYAMTMSDGSVLKVYDSSKKKLLATLSESKNTEYLRQAAAGEVFYIKLPDKIDEELFLVAVLKDGFGTMKAGNTYAESATGETIYHPFSLTKRSWIEIRSKVMDKNKGNITVKIQKYVDGKWKTIGYSATLTPTKGNKQHYTVYGLQPGKYRAAFKAEKDQVYAIAYSKATVKKKVAYKKSKAKKISKSTLNDNIYTTEETAARWYKFTRKASDKKNSLNITKQTVKGGFKFTFYKEGKKKPIKTIKVKTNEEYGIVKLPKGKGTYYIKVSKLTKKTSGYYSIADWN